MNTKQTNQPYQVPSKATSDSAIAASNQQETTKLLASGLFALSVLATLLLTMSTADARWYKWVDENGKIFYQDQPPPADYRNSTHVLNTQGVTVKRIPSREEQIAIDEKKKLESEKNQRDKMLLKSFPAEADLSRTREKRIGHIDGTVTRMHDQLVILNSRLVSIEDKIEQRAKANRKPTPVFESDRAAVIRSINSTKALIKSKLKERRQVSAKFDDDLIRYRELTAGTKVQNAAIVE